MISDVPELLIALSLVGAIAWAIYNWTHPHPQQETRKMGARR
jgi:hypothetical protein